VQGLLDRVTLLGPDPQYWTVYVIGWQLSLAWRASGPSCRPAGGTLP
jgi:hypothetical protein